MATFDLTSDQMEHLFPHIVKCTAEGGSIIAQIEIREDGRLVCIAGNVNSDQYVAIRNIIRGV